MAFLWSMNRDTPYYIVSPRLCLRADVAAIHIHAGLVEHMGYVVYALTLGDVSIVKTIVFLHMQGALARYGQILVPVHGHLVRTAVATPLADVRQASLRTVAVSEDRDKGIAIGPCLFLGLQYAVGYTRRMLKPVLSPEVGQCLVLPESTLALHVVPVNVLLRPYLLVHGHAEQRSQTEVDSAEVASVDAVEVFLGLLVVEVLVLTWIHVQVEFLDVLGDDGIDHVVLAKVEIIAITHLVVPE